MTIRPTASSFGRRSGRTTGVRWHALTRLTVARSDPVVALRPGPSHLVCIGLATRMKYQDVSYVFIGLIRQFFQLTN